MERTIQGAEGDIGADCEARDNHQEKDNWEEWETKRKVLMEESGSQKRNGYQIQEWKIYNWCMKHKCGPFKKQVNVNWKVLRRLHQGGKRWQGSAIKTSSISNRGGWRVSQMTTKSLVFRNNGNQRDDYA